MSQDENQNSGSPNKSPRYIVIVGLIIVVLGAIAGISIYNAAITNLNTVLNIERRLVAKYPDCEEIEEISNNLKHITPSKVYTISGSGIKPNSYSTEVFLNRIKELTEIYEKCENKVQTSHKEADEKQVENELNIEAQNLEQQRIANAKNARQSEDNFRKELQRRLDDDLAAKIAKQVSVAQEMAKQDLIRKLQEKQAESERQQLEAQRQQLEAQRRELEEILSNIRKTRLESVNKSIEFAQKNGELEAKGFKYVCECSCIRGFYANVNMATKMKLNENYNTEEPGLDSCTGFMSNSYVNKNKAEIEKYKTSLSVKECRSMCSRMPQP